MHCWRSCAILGRNAFHERGRGRDRGACWVGNLQRSEIDARGLNTEIMYSKRGRELGAPNDVMLALNEDK
jgi:hypothetical protein